VFLYQNVQLHLTLFGQLPYTFPTSSCYYEADKDRVTPAKNHSRDNPAALEAERKFMATISVRVCDLTPNGRCDGGRAATHLSFDRLSPTAPPPHREVLSWPR